MAFVFGDEGTASGGIGASTFAYAGRFSCSENVDIGQLRAYNYSSGSVSMKVALYSDNSGTPGTLLAANDGGTSVSGSSWGEFDITATSVSSGTDYWIAITCDTSGAIGYSSSSSGDHSGANTSGYSGYSFPSTWTEDYTGNYSFLLAAYSTAVELGGGTFSYSGGNITSTQSIAQSVIGGTFSFSGGSLPDGTIGGLIEQDLLGGIFSYSGGDIESGTALTENLLGGTFSYSGGSLIESVVYAPLIDSVSDETIVDEQTGITISGSNFLASGATLELCNSSNYAGSSVKIPQSITAQSDTSITFTCDHGDQLYGYKYLFVTNSDGANNAIGFRVNVGRTCYVFVTNSSGSRTDGFPITMFEGETNLLTDGDMEYANTSAWASASGGVLSKSSSIRPGSNGILSLRVDVASGDSYAGARQSPLVSATQYRITGWAIVSNGLSAAIGNVTGTDIATFSAASWTEFDETFTASGSNIYLGYAGGILPGDYVLYDDVKIVKV